MAADMVRGGAAGVILRSHPVHAALSLVLTLFGVSVLFVAQEANFLAAVQVIVYAGAIDDKRSSRPEDVKTANNFVRIALTEAMAGKPVSTPNTTPYGCSVKY